MRYPACEKLEIIRTVETSPLPVRCTLDKIGIPRTTFYAWLDRYAAGGLDALEDRKPRPKRVWNRIPQEVRDKLIERALDGPELAPRKVAVAFTDAEKTFVFEASVYRILKAEGLVTSPAFIVMKAADRFANPTTAINQLWETEVSVVKGAEATARNRRIGSSRLTKLFLQQRTSWTTWKASSTLVRQTSANGIERRASDSSRCHAHWYGGFLHPECATLRADRLWTLGARSTRELRGGRHVPVRLR